MTANPLDEIRKRAEHILANANGDTQSEQDCMYLLSQLTASSAREVAMRDALRDCHDAALAAQSLSAQTMTEILGKIAARVRQAIAAVSDGGAG